MIPYGSFHTNATSKKSRPPSGNFGPNPHELLRSPSRSIGSVKNAGTHWQLEGSGVDKRVVFQKGGFGECTPVQVFVSGEHANVPSFRFSFRVNIRMYPFRFSFRGNIRQNCSKARATRRTLGAKLRFYSGKKLKKAVAVSQEKIQFGKPPFCQPPKHVTSLEVSPSRWEA